MSNKGKMTIIVLLLCAGIANLNGCASTTQPSKFYVLSPSPQSEAPQKTSNNYTGMPIIIGPITLPAYLNRSQIVTLTTENELKLAEYHRWAEPIKENIARVLMERLSILLDTNQIAIHPRRFSNRSAYQITLDVIRFEAGPGDHAYLNVFWTIYGEDGREALSIKKSDFSIQIESKDYSSIVAAQNRLLIEFCSELAASLSNMKE
jgi:uncharacterized lipoprotein YmbA